MEWNQAPGDGPQKGIQKPGPSAGGSPEESVEGAEGRSSESLRHRGRAVSLWDYERLVLEQFPTIYKVGVVGGIVGSLILIGWMLSNIKGPRGRLGQDPILALETGTPTAVPITPTASLPAPAPPAEPTATDHATATPTSTPQPIDINFNADSYSITQGECTTLRWSVTGAETVIVLGQEVEHTEAEQVCPGSATRYQLVAENGSTSQQSGFTIEVLDPTPSEEKIGCTGYDGNGQLVCKESCTDNDPKDPCSLD